MLLTFEKAQETAKPPAHPSHTACEACTVRFASKAGAKAHSITQQRMQKNTSPQDLYALSSKTVGSNGIQPATLKKDSPPL